MGKLIELAVVACLACRWLTGRWPWQFGARPPAPPAPETAQNMAEARAVLGVGPQSSRADIIEAHKRLILDVHPDRGGSNERAHQANAARDLLLAELTRPQEHP